MSVINSEGRFILVEKPLAYPFVDIVTKTTEGPLFDLSVDLDNFEGVPYVKAEHVEEMAKTLGMATKEEVDALNERIRELEAENTRLPEHSEELVNGINSLVSDYYSRIRPSVGDADVILDSSLIEDSGESDTESSESSGSQWKAGDRDDFEVHDLLDGIDGQSDSDVGNKRPNSVPASSSDEFGFS
jgi:predicted nuclease with TOPRIM domain